jgi:8-oxo-dGTP diphosphatase
MKHINTFIIMKEYVCGFLFTEDKKKVVLIRKNKPEWQKGLLNGIGGKAEESDFNSKFAMSREMYEETGLMTFIDDWVPLCTINTKDELTTVDFFYTIAKRPFTIKQLTSEKIILFPIKNINKVPCIPNLRWLIPMCFDPQHISGIIICNASMKEDMR